MKKTRRAWPAYAITAEEIEIPNVSTKDRVARLVARVSPDQDIPTTHVGRELHIILSRPMLEVLARLAQDLGVVDYVDFLERTEYDDDSE